MICFSCTSCGRLLKVKNELAGRKGKCPECGTRVVVPKQTNAAGTPPIIKFRCPTCQQKIGLKAEYAGKKVRCAKCKNILRVPGAAATSKDGEHGASTPNKDGSPKTESPDPSSSEWAGSAGMLEALRLAEAEAPTVSRPQDDSLDDSEPTPSFADAPAIGASVQPSDPEPDGQRRLPWPIDIPLYPFSIGGIITIAIIIGMRILAPFFCCFAIFVRVPALFYLAWYFSECIRDTALGGTRAPGSLGRMESPYDMSMQLIRLILCHTIYLNAGPTLYYVYRLFSHTAANEDVVLWLRLAGSFFFPMAVIAISILESIDGFNPILLVRSIAKTFLPYCGLVILCFGLIFGYHLFEKVSVAASLINRSLVGLLISVIASGLLYYWALLVGAHILGRFYWRYEDKLNW